MEIYEQLQLNGFEQTESPGGGITVLSAGFPCQPYSLAGKGLGDGDSRDLWGEVARILREVRPKWFVGENTPGLFARNNQRFFRRVIDDITEIGYSVSWALWGACDVGVPHQRDRVFFVGRNADSDNAEAERTLPGRGESAHATGDNRNFPDTDSERWAKVEIFERNNEKSGNVQNCEEKKEGLLLGEYVAVFPNTEGKQTEQNGGKLNPEWVEWLQGFPIGWTDCDV